MFPTASFGEGFQGLSGGAPEFFGGLAQVSGVQLDHRSVEKRG